jgi:long-chain acyl-CoA synthetase
VIAFVVAHDGHSVSDSELIAFCRERLSAYKCPRDVVFRSELPTTLTGKILRRQLRDEWTERAADRST